MGETVLEVDPEYDPDDWHHLLLRLAGLLPDDVIADARAWLDEGSTAEMAALLAFTALGLRVPVWDADALMLLDEMARSEQELQPLGDLVVTDVPENDDGRWTFAPLPVTDLEGAEAAALVLDLSGSSPGLDDAVDRAAVAAVSREAEAVAMWRAWRVPADARARLDPPSAQPRRVFLVLARAPSQDEAGLTARLQEELLAAGEDSPQVEVWTEGAEPPGYQRAAWLRSALLWAREPASPILVARSFDAVDPQTGPTFDADHPRLADAVQIDRLLDYLLGAPTAMESDTLLPDLFDPGADVPMSLRTDGVWVWSESVPYYLEQYALSPDPDFMSYLEAVSTPFPEVSPVALHRVWCFLLQPPP